MKSRKIAKVAFSAALATLTFGVIGEARADDPLKYPPFSWPSDAPAAKQEKKNAGKPAKPDVYQTTDEKKQWYDGDFLGLDDD